MDLEQVTERSAPKKMGSRAMNTRLPYASAVPSGVATNLAVAFSASVPLESVEFRASRTAEASGAEAGTGSASDMVVQSGASGAAGGAGAVTETDTRRRRSGQRLIHPAALRRLDKATFP